MSSVMVRLGVERLDQLLGIAPGLRALEQLVHQRFLLPRSARASSSLISIIAIGQYPRYSQNDVRRSDCRSLPMLDGHFRRRRLGRIVRTRIAVRAARR